MRVNASGAAPPQAWYDGPGNASTASVDGRVTSYCASAIITGQMLLCDVYAVMSLGVLQSTRVSVCTFR
jgi:hypothetical protein